MTTQQAQYELQSEMSPSVRVFRRWSPQERKVVKLVSYSGAQIDGGFDFDVVETDDDAVVAVVVAVVAVAMSVAVGVDGDVVDADDVLEMSNVVAWST